MSQTKNLIKDILNFPNAEELGKFLDELPKYVKRVEFVDWHINEALVEIDPNLYEEQEKKWSY